MVNRTRVEGGGYSKHDIIEPNFAPGSFALQQSVRLVYMLRALSRGRNRATRATRDNQDAHTPTEHTRSATETQHNSQPETPKGSWPLLLPSRRRRRRRCFCCCCCHIRVPLLRVLRTSDAVLGVANRSFLFSFFDTRFVFFL